ncbi:hypothetical protein NTGZN8_60107 [Candidatus Nitrotoga fabula]|uniref:Uncharacterized protein n=1 Tax=Candidatus Nitrotoga fabula TaxID=2182327 RepID=A0A916BHQ0_9PROT|nr:hypothetical protein NTGZN8_60107 [Candidatus Nitrotoga fabula]
MHSIFCFFHSLLSDKIFGLTLMFFLRDRMIPGSGMGAFL